jgi:UDP-N-acetyl-D-galactosamine dehydrogenase
VDVVDPHADPGEVKREYGIELSGKISPPYDAIVVAVNHDDYVGLDEEYFASITTENALLMDIKGLYRGKIRKLKYWSL